MFQVSKTAGGLIAKMTVEIISVVNLVRFRAICSKPIRNDAKGRTVFNERRKEMLSLEKCEKPIACTLFAVCNYFWVKD